MKKSTIAVPVAIALLSFGISTQSMANPTNTSTGTEADQIAAVVGVADDNGNNATENAIAVKDTLNGNTTSDIANDKSTDDNSILSHNKVDVENVANDKSGATVTVGSDSDRNATATNDSVAIAVDKSKDAEAEVENGDYNAVAAFGDAYVDKSTHIKIKDVNVAVIKSEVKGEVKDNYLSFGKDLDQDSYGNIAEADNKSFSINKSDQDNKSFQIQKSDQDIKQIQVNKEAALNAAIQVEKSKQGNEAVGVNVPVGVNVNEAEGTDTATGGTGGGAGDDANADADANDAALALQANKSDDPTNKAEGENKSEQEAKAKVGSKQGDQANTATAGNTNEQGESSTQANTADLANTTTQTATADAGSYSSTQSQTVYLTTGSNTMTNFSANGVNALAQNTGVQSFIQQTQNVQANVY